MTASLRRALLAGALLVAAPAALAQTGKLSGKIVDPAGEPVVGAIVQIDGTTLGAAADLDGDYTILQIPPGTYRVRVSAVGYGAVTVEGVRVASNQTTTLNRTLAEEDVEGAEVVVTSERPVVDTQVTSSFQTLSREDIATLPVQQLADIVNLQAGVVDGHFRGGRQGEVQYQVDGVSVNNPYDNRSTVTLDRSVLQEVQVISGTFDAEYGQAMSGVVNAVLRAGDDERYEYGFETYLGDYVSPGSDSTTVTTPLFGTQRVALYPGIDRVSPLARQHYQANLSGPVPFLPQTTFLLNGQRGVDRGYLFGQRLFVPTDSSDFENQVFTGTGDGAWVPLGFGTNWSWLAKIANRSIQNVAVSYQVLGGAAERQGYNQGFRFNPDGTKTAREFSLVHGLDLSHTLTPFLFYEVALRQNLFDYRDYKYEDVRDPRYFAAGQPQGDANFRDGAIVEGVDLGRFVQRTNSLVGKATVTWQANKYNLVKGGVELQRSVLEFGVPGALQFVNVGGVQQLGVVEDTLGAEVLRYRPMQGAAFVQDRVEWGDLRIRAGLRFEFFDANSTVPSDLQNPANAIQGAPASSSRRTTVKWALAPRLGVSFPVADKASVFFSYGHFYQLPGLGQFFQNADYSVLRDLQAGAVSYGVLGNPDLRPEFTAQYEFGVKAELARWLGLDVSAFYKDIRDLLGVEFVDTYTAASYARLTNVDFGGVRGLTLSVDQRGPGRLTSTLDYTLQVAVGNSSDPQETANRAAAGGDPRPRQVPFAWDQRHTLNASVVWQPRGFVLTGIARLASGQPYTPTLSTGFGGELEPNSGRKPLAFTVDLRAERGFRLAGLGGTVFARVFNLLDARYNNGFVYADTGSPFYTLNAAAQRNPDPTRLNAPRRIEIGVSLRGERAASGPARR